MTETPVTPTTGPVASKNPFQTTLGWIHDHLLLAIGSVVCAILFLFLGHFAEFFLAGLKLFAVLLFFSVGMHFGFPGTLHKYVNEDQLLKDFWGASPEVRLKHAVILIVAILVVSALCFVRL